MVAVVCEIKNKVMVLRVKELREQAEQAERSAAAKEAEQRARAESLQAKVAEQVLSIRVILCDWTVSILELILKLT